MKKIALVGATGSIGRQVVSVCKKHSDKFQIVAMAINSNIDILREELNEMTPSYIAINSEEAYKKFKAQNPNINVNCGTLALLEVARYKDADIVIIAASGFAGLKYTIEALKAGKNVALANKESLVCGGDIVNKLAQEKGIDIIPIDSEHSAIWQCLNYNKQTKFKRLIITASGGPFKTYTKEQLKFVKAKDALKHPTWNMGAKITIDSATLLNKGYEVIEAHHLYNCGFDKIKTVIQPQSIIHSMVEFEDGAYIAQLSNPSMEVPICQALSYPERLDIGLKPLNFDEMFSLDFIPLKRENFPCYDIALKCGELSGIYPTILNASAEVAVNSFLKDEIGFLDIYNVISESLEMLPNEKVESFERLEEIDKITRENSNKIIKNHKI